MVKQKIREPVRLISSGYLEQYTMKELVKIYNGTHPKSKVKTFSSHVEAVRMILERLYDLSKREPSRLPTGGQRNVRQLLDIPKIEKPRGTRRALSASRLMILRMVKRAKGATIDQIQEVMEYNRRQTIEQLRFINRDLGHGFKEEEVNGKLQLIE